MRRGILPRFGRFADHLRAGGLRDWPTDAEQYQSTTRAYDVGYDAANQLTSAVYRTTDATPTILRRYGYSYDAAGNRTNQQADDAPTGDPTVISFSFL